jgi:hypothetical protein
MSGDLRAKTVTAGRRALGAAGFAETVGADWLASLSTDRPPLSGRPDSNPPTL